MATERSAASGTPKHSHIWLGTHKAKQWRLGLWQSLVHTVGLWVRSPEQSRQAMPPIYRQRHRPDQNTECRAPHTAWWRQSFLAGRPIARRAPRSADRRPTRSGPRHRTSPLGSRQRAHPAQRRRPDSLGSLAHISWSWDCARRRHRRPTDSTACIHHHHGLRQTPQSGHRALPGRRRPTPKDGRQLIRFLCRPRRLGGARHLCARRRRVPPPSDPGRAAGWGRGPRRGAVRRPCELDTEFGSQVHTVAAAAATLRSLRVCDRHGGWPNSRDVSRSPRAARWGAQGRLRRVRGRGRRGQRGMDTQSARTCRRGGAGRAAGELLRQRHDLRHGSALVGAAGRTAGLARAGRSESRHLAPK